MDVFTFTRIGFLFALVVTTSSCKFNNLIEGNGNLVDPGVDLELPNPDATVPGFVNDTTLPVNITENADVKKWCLSEVLTTAPNIDEPCIGGQGPDQGWYTSKPTSFDITSGDGVKVIFLWVANENVVLNKNSIQYQVNLDTSAPSPPTVNLEDPISHSSVLTSNNPVDLAITSSEAELSWCVLEQALAASPPDSPLAGDSCWQTTKPSHVQLGDLGQRSVYVFLKDQAGNVSGSGSASIDFQFNDPTLVVSDPTTASTSYARQATISVSISGDGAASKWCVSQSQTTAPLATDSCAGGSGPSNGWHLTQPTSYDLTGTGSQTVYLWIANNGGTVNAGPVSKSITLDTTPPNTPSSLTLTDPDSNTANTAYQANINIKISGDSGASAWCVIEQDSVSAAPLTPAYNDACWGSPRPTTATLGALGGRSVYVFTRDVAYNISASYKKTDITFTANGSPTAVSDSYTIVQGDSKPQSFHVIANDNDAESDNLTIASTTNGSQGTVAIHSNSKHLTYTLTNLTFTGLDTFTYSIQDPYGNVSSNITVNVNVVGLANWSNRKQITVSGSISPIEARTNFPLHIKITGDSNLQTKAQTNGEDILFVSSDLSTVLPHEIEHYDSSSGDLLAWVNIPSISANTGFSIYMYYGNGSAQAMQRPYDTWSNNYAAVFHMKEDPTLKNDGFCTKENAAICDSSQNHNHGTNTGGTLDPSGAIGNSFRVSGGNYLTYKCNNCPTFPYTISLWFNPTTLSGNLISYRKGDQKSIAMSGSTYLHVGPSHHRKGLLQSSLSTSTWQHLTVVYTASSDISVYLNGVANMVDTNDYWNAGSYTMGRRLNFSALSYNGALDEVRIYSGSFSAEQAKSHYNTQNNPSAYLSIGPEE